MLLIPDAKRDTFEEKNNILKHKTFMKLKEFHQNNLKKDVTNYKEIFQKKVESDVDQN